MADLPKSVRDYIQRITSKGGKARALKLSARRRSEIARKAGKQSWRNRNGAKREKRVG